jgi:site-specific DNA recombinase
VEVIRLVGVVRQSKRSGDQAVSEAGQTEAILADVELKNRQAEAEGKRFEIIGWAIDIGVSADKFDPWQRPELGKWLKKPHTFDGLISYKLDRISRTMFDFAKLMKWLEDSGKLLICTRDSFDLSTEIGRAVAGILAILAEMELNNIKTRNQQTRKTLNEAGRDVGGHVPYGRKRVNGKLVIDSNTVKGFQRILELLYEGKAINAIAKTLNEEGIPTSKEQGQWQGAAITKMLRSRHLIGQREVNGVVVKDAEGMPVLYCDALLTIAEWNRLQKKLDGMSSASRSRAGTSLGRNVGGCIDCGSNLQATGSGKSKWESDRRYRCATIGKRINGRTDVERCGNPSIKMSVFDGYLESAILDMVGSQPRRVKVFVPGEDYTEELEQVDDSISSLQEESDRGLIRNREEYFSRLEKLMSRRDKLVALPNRPAGFRYEATGETVAEYWNSMDKEARNLWLQEMGVRLFYSLKSGAPKFRMDLGDLNKLLLLAQGIDEEEAE